MSGSQVGALCVGRKAFESYKVLRGYAEHEGTLLNNRVTWLLVSNAFLFASAGFTVREMASSDSDVLALFVLGSAVAGFLFSLVSFPSILASYKASDALRQAWSSYSNELSEPDAGAKEYFVVPISGGGNDWASKGGSYAALILPVLLVVMWIIVFCYFYTHSGAEHTCSSSADVADFRQCAIFKLQQIIDTLGDIRNSTYLTVD